MQDDDLSLFQSAVRGVKPIKHDRAETGKPRSNREQIANRRSNAIVNHETTRVDGLSDQFVIDVAAEDELYWARDGVQDSQVRKLKAGQIPFEGSLDLHGMSVEKARELLWDFIAEATRLEVRCVRVTHGKAARLDGNAPADQEPRQHLAAATSSSAWLHVLPATSWRNRRHLRDAQAHHARRQGRVKHTQQITRNTCQPSGRPLPFAFAPS